MTDRYIKVYPDGSRSPSRHPGWRVGESPETARLLTADELAEHGWYKVVDDIPAHDEATQYAKPTQVADWPIRGKRIIRTFTVEDRPPPPRRYVPKSVIVRRLDAAGLLATAKAAIPTLPLVDQELWNAHSDIWSEDPRTLAFLRGIGADPDVILAPGETR